MITTNTIMLIIYNYLSLINYMLTTMEDNMLTLILLVKAQDIMIMMIKTTIKKTETQQTEII